MVGKTQQKHIQEEHMLSFKFLLNAATNHELQSPQKNHVHKNITNKQEAQ